MLLVLPALLHEGSATGAAVDGPAVSADERCPDTTGFVLGDNFAALQDAIARRGQGRKLTVARELCSSASTSSTSRRTATSMRTR